MNRTLIITIFHSFFLLSCSTGIGKITLKLEEHNSPVLARLSKQDSTISLLKIPVKMDILNSSKLKTSFIKIDYEYGSLKMGYGLSPELYNYDKDVLNPVSNNREKHIYWLQSKEYLLYSRHFIDTSKVTQQTLKSYTQKMLAQNKDTLHIGTVSEFKTKHPILFEKLTKNDSISIRLLEDGKLGKRITVPVEW